jgi:hypothetical protein
MATTSSLTDNTNDCQSKTSEESARPNSKNEVKQQQPKTKCDEPHNSKKRRDRGDDIILADEEDEVNKMKKIKKAMRETFSSAFDPVKLGLDFGTARVFGLSIMESFGNQVILKQVRESKVNSDKNQKTVGVEDIIRTKAKDKIKSIIDEQDDKIVKMVAGFIFENGNEIIASEQHYNQHPETVMLIPSSINITITPAISIQFNIFEFKKPLSECDLEKNFHSSYFQFFKYAFDFLRIHPLCLMNDKGTISHFLKQRRLSLKNSIVSRIESEFDSKIKSLQREMQVLVQEQSQADLECEFQKAIVWHSQNDITILQDKILKIQLSMDNLHSSMEQCKEDGGCFSEETKAEMERIKKSNGEMIERLLKPLNDGLTKKLNVQLEITEKYEAQLRLAKMITDNIMQREIDLKEFSSHKNKDFLLNQAKTSALAEFDTYVKRLEPFFSLAEGEDVRERKMDKVLKCIISLDEVLLDGQMAMYKSLQNAFGVADQK